MLRQDNNRAETAPPKSAESGNAIASEGVALRGTPIINNALAKTANIYIYIYIYQYLCGFEFICLYGFNKI